MARSKKLFMVGTLAFLALLFYASYDIAKRTTFPGHKPQLKTRLQDAYRSKDSVPPGKIQVDSVNTNEKIN